MIYILTMALSDFQLRYQDFKTMTYADIKCYTRIYIEQLNNIDKTMYHISQNILLNYQQQILNKKKHVTFDMSYNTIKYI
jgi:hypothetical protein